jgi:hypothetical protein
VKTSADVLEHAGAFLQLYREEGWYLERTVHFVSRVGLDYVKKRVLADARAGATCGTGCNSRSRVNPIPGTSRRAPASTRGSSFRLPRCRPHRRPRRRGRAARVNSPMDGSAHRLRHRRTWRFVSWPTSRGWALA